VSVYQKCSSDHITVSCWGGVKRRADRRARTVHRTAGVLCEIITSAAVTIVLLDVGVGDEETS
jgi:hypothetical protein